MSCKYKVGQIVLWDSSHSPRWYEINKIIPDKTWRGSYRLKDKLGQYCFDTQVQLTCRLAVTLLDIPFG